MMASLHSLFNLIAGSLRLYLESKPFPLTKESEKDLLLYLTRIHKQIQRWGNESNVEGELFDSNYIYVDMQLLKTSMPFLICKVGRGFFCVLDTSFCNLRKEEGHTDAENNCFMDITSIMVTFLGYECGFVRHLAVKILVDTANLLSNYRSKGLKFLHLLWISLGLTMSSITQRRLSSVPIESVCDPNENWMQFFTKADLPGIEDSDINISTFIALLQSRVAEINLYIAVGIFQAFRKILKSLKHENNELERACTYLSMSSLLKMPGNWLNELHIIGRTFGEADFVGRNKCLTRSINMLVALILQLLCSLVEQNDLINAEGDFFGGQAISTKFMDLVLKLLPGFSEHLGCDMSLYRYMTHKLLMLMTRLRFHVQRDVSHLVLWLKLLTHKFEDFLYVPIGVPGVASATTIEESPFLAFFDSGDKVQNLCTKHLQRQIIFLFLFCCFRLIHFNNDTGRQLPCGGQHSSVNSTSQMSCEHCTCMGLIQLFEWLQKCASLENVVDLESYRKSCCSFATFFLQFFMEEDDLLFDILLQLLDSPVINLQICSGQLGISFKDLKKDIIFVISCIFNPIYLFHLFLFLLHYDHLVLVDYLISKDTGIRFLQYLLRCLRIVCMNWEIFLRFPMYGSENNLSPYKRRNIYMDVKLEILPLPNLMAQGHKVARLTAGDVDQSTIPQAFENAKACLITLKKTVEDFYRKDLFPYNPKPLLRSLTRFEELSDVINRSCDSEIMS